MWFLKVSIYFRIRVSNNSLALLTSSSGLLNLNLSPNILWSFTISCLPAEGSAWTCSDCDSLQKWTFSKIMNQVRTKGNPQHLLDISPEQNLSRNIRMCPVIQMNNVKNALEETSIYFMAIHSLGHKALLFWVGNIGQDTSIVPHALWRVSCDP